MSGSVLRKKVWLSSTRVDSGSSPVRIDARDGLHTGYWTYARSNKTPRPASRSKLGERTAVSPYAPRLLRRSSATMNSTLGCVVELRCCAVAGDASVDIATASTRTVASKPAADRPRGCAARLPAANAPANLLAFI